MFSLIVKNFSLILEFLTLNQKVIIFFYIVSFFSFLIFVFKYNRFIYILLGIEILSLSLFLSYSFKFYSFFFFYFLCFVVVSRVTGLVILFSYIKSYSYDKSFL